MLQTQRDRAILDHLTRQGSARIEDLARTLSVSEETVRRAVKRLEQLGSVTRVHGGVHLRDVLAEPSLSLRLGVNPGAKRRIAARVAGLIENGSSLFLDVGSTTAFVAQALRDHRELFVVTNSLTVAQALTGRGGNRVFMAGGELRPHDGGAFGAEALAFVTKFRVHHAILTAAALNEQAGFMLNDLHEAEVSRAILSCAETATVVADASKFGAFAPMRIAEPSAFDRLVTDAAPQGALADLLQGAGVKVILA
jgi:DeoR family glycerol-3-phosphate regulon repressor